MKYNKKEKIKSKKNFQESNQKSEEKSPTFQISQQNKIFDTILIKSDEKWFNQLPKYTYKKPLHSPELLLNLKTKAQILLNEDIKLHGKFQSRKNDKDLNWVKRILKTGTLSDKVSAYTLLIQDSPVHNLHNVELLVNMVNTKGKRECLMAVDALKDLFTSELLIEERKLKPFNEQPLDDIDEISGHDEITKKRLLVLWLFEDKVKALYETFLKNIDLVSHDTVEKTKQRAVNVMYTLLKENPEQEQFLLERLVNKIGDPVPKIGSHVCYLLGQLVDHHSNMNGVVMQEVERLLFRPNIPERTKYYCLCFLNQIILSHEEFDLANRLISLYFGQFRVCIKKGEVDTKIMSALLTGVARAYPYAQLKDNMLMEQLDAMYRLVHMVNFNISIQALLLIFQVLDSSNSISDRFYCTLYRKISDPALCSSSRQTLLLNLIYRALKNDVSSIRVKAFVKRLLQVAIYQAPNLQCGILILISEIAKIHTDLLDSKLANDSKLAFSDSDSDEHYEDVPDEDEVKSEGQKDTKPDLSIKKSTHPTSWVHKPQRIKNKSKNTYDPDARNPLHSCSDYSTLWELLHLKRSFHPSVSLFANQIFNSKSIKYSGDPLLDFTTQRFLDRFVYRNPKKMPESFKTDLHRKVFGSRKLKSLDSNHVAISSDAFIQQNVEKVPVEERFIYQFLRQRASESKHNKKDDSDIESVGSDDFQKLLDEIHPEDEGRDTLNFAEELQLHKKNKSSKRKAKSDSEESEDLESVGSESDLEDDLDFEGEEFDEAFKDIDEEMQDLDENVACEEDFLDDGNFDSEKPQRKKVKKNKNFGNDSLFASADEFSTILEDNAGDKVDTITANALCNKDKSAAKQLSWERQRDQFVKGTDWKSRKNKKFQKKNKFIRKK